jgi:hypothetical protein
MNTYLIMLETNQEIEAKGNEIQIEDGVLKIVSNNKIVSAYGRSYWVSVRKKEEALT